ncbi:MAG: hypothetical protein ACI9OJ_000692, partial [Myxococcota bacterium]
RTRTIERPVQFFDDDGKMPKSAELTLVVPPTHAHMTPGEFSGLVARAIGEKEAEARTAREADGGSWSGPQACRSVSLDTYATAVETKGSRLPPPVLEPLKELRELALDVINNFRNAYRERRASWLEGDTTSRWPAGTWRMVQHLAAPAHPPPSDCVLSFI